MKTVYGYRQAEFGSSNYRDKYSLNHGSKTASPIRHALINGNTYHILILGILIVKFGDILAEMEKVLLK